MSDIYGVYSAQCKAFPYSRNARRCRDRLPPGQAPSTPNYPSTLFFASQPDSHLPHDIVASAPLAFTTPSPEFCAGIATGVPRCFTVKLTISSNIVSRVSRARSSTSEGCRFFVSIGFKTVNCEYGASILVCQTYLSPKSFQT